MKANTKATMTIEETRAAYRRHRSGLVWSAGAGATNATFDDAVRAILAKLGKADPTPADYLAAAERVALRCGRCAGTGAFVTRVENGVPKGPGGSCYRCAGKGVQTVEDAHRNNTHDRHYCPPEFR